MKLQLKVGNYYRTRNGTVCYCVGIDPFPNATEDNYICTFEDEAAVIRYFSNGNWMSIDQLDSEKYPYDIIEEMIEVKEIQY